MIKMGSFRSYVGLEEYEMKIPRPVNGAFLQPNFLDGELVVAEADNVLKFTSISKKKGLSGSLFVTNARLVFVSSDRVCTEDSIPLLSINTLCYYEEPKGSGGRRIKRKVKLGVQGLDSPVGAASSALFSSASTRVHELLVNCSNFRSMRVSFKFSLVDHGQKICNALIHWSFPTRPEKLFYVDYCRAAENQYKSINSLPLYNIPGDWLREIKISRTTGHRISLANINFEMCESLQEAIVVPADVSDVRVISLSGKLKGSRPPFWVWGDMNGSAILRMGQLHNESDSAAENQFFETLRKAHPQKRPPNINDLDNSLPLKELRLSMTRLFELCCSESLSHVEDADSKFLSNVESTKWLSWISKVLQVALEVAESIVKFNDVIILQENESRDTSCLIGSVAQIILDARFRTVTGFFTLIQKDWVSTGHPFHSNYMHSSPLFLLFLDSVYQLLHQNPFEFEFNETLLTDIWDSCFDPTTGTFLFDTPSQRKSLDMRKDLSVWNRILSKDESASDEELGQDAYQRQSLFPSVQTIPTSLLNPLYKLKNILSPPVPSAFRNNHPPLLQCYPSIAQIKLWTSLYLDRTTEPFDISSPPTTLSVSSPTPYVKNMGNLSPRKPSMSSPAGSSSNSPSPSRQRCTFLFSGNKEPEPESCTAAGGKNFEIEQKLVDLLLLASTSSTKYQKHNHTSSSSTTKLRSQPDGPNQSNPVPPVIPPRAGWTRSSGGSLRRNPFLES